MQKRQLTESAFFYNKRLVRRYQIVETIVAGIVLQGWEIRAVFANQFVLENSFAIVQSNQLYLLNFKITPLADARLQVKLNSKHKLLLTKRQLRQWIQQKHQFNYTIIPTHVLLANGKIKLRLALAKGRKQHETRQAALERDWRKHKRNDRID